MGNPLAAAPTDNQKSANDTVSRPSSLPPALGKPQPVEPEVSVPRTVTVVRVMLPVSNSVEMV